MRAKLASLFGLLAGVTFVVGGGAFALFLAQAGGHQFASNTTIISIGLYTGLMSLILAFLALSLSRRAPTRGGAPPFLAYPTPSTPAADTVRTGSSRSLGDRRWFESGYVRLVVAIVIATSVAIGATLLGANASSPSIVRCQSSYCEEAQYDSYGWPIPWRTDAPPAAVEGLLRDVRHGRPFGLGITSHGISRYALGATVGLWFAAAFGTLVLIDALVSRRWRRSNLPLRLATAFTVALGLAAVAVILGALRTSAGSCLSIPCESAGWPIEWKTSPWSRFEPSGSKMAEGYWQLVRPYNMLGFSPLYLGMTFVFWYIMAACTEVLLFIVWQARHAVGWRRRRPAPSMQA